MTETIIHVDETLTFKMDYNKYREQHSADHLLIVEYPVVHHNIGEKVVIKETVYQVVDIICWPELRTTEFVLKEAIAQGTPNIY